MTISPWVTLLCSIPTLLIGEQLVQRIPLLSKFKIPASVIGGALVSVLVLAFYRYNITLESSTSEVAWSWLTVAEPSLASRPSFEVYRPFLIAFFASIGLSASTTELRSAGRKFPILVALAAFAVVMQNTMGTVLARLLGESPFLGLLCGSVTLTGGHGTALGFAKTFEKLGLEGADTIGMSAATVGLLMGGLLGAPVGSSLIRRYKLETPGNQEEMSDHDREEHNVVARSPWLRDLYLLITRDKRKSLFHMLLVLVCLKVGAWMSLGMQTMKWNVPVYVGALFVGIFVRFVLDRVRPGLASPQIIDHIGSVSLGIFLTCALMTMNLASLQGSASSMFVIVGMQIVMMVLITWFLTFRLMGKDYEAAVMAGGHMGFGLGASPTAIASMKSLVDIYGPAHRAFVLVPMVGSFFIDIINTVVITVFLNAMT